MSINSDNLKTALKGLNIQFGKQINYESVAKELKFVPKKMVKGKETKQVLKVGGQKYKEAVYKEALRVRELKVQKIKNTGVTDTIIPVKQKGKKLVESLMNKFYQKFQYQYEGIDNELDYYDAIKLQRDTFEGDADYVSIPFKEKTSGKLFWRNINTSSVSSYEKFKAEIDKIQKTGIAGSDALLENDFEPDYEFFSIGEIGRAHV